MSNNKKIIRPLVFTLCLCLGSVLLIAGNGVAGELPAGVEAREVIITSKVNLFNAGTNRESGSLNVEGEEIDQMIGFITVDNELTRGQKAEDDLPYRFNGNTLVRSAKKNTLTMNELLVPCKAWIYFYPNTRKSPILYGIDMIGRYKSSSRNWSKITVNE